jgi:glutaredoxin-related protein
MLDNQTSLTICPLIVNFAGGFSAKVVQALKDNDVDFGSVNVLDYPDIREGVKKFA